MYVCVCEREGRKTTRKSIMVANNQSDDLVFTHSCAMTRSTGCARGPCITRALNAIILLLVDILLASTKAAEATTTLHIRYIR